MQYLGLDVHLKSTVWCLLNAEGEVIGRGKVETTAAELRGLVQRLNTQAGGPNNLICGQEVGTLSYLVRDTVSTYAKLLSFNAQHLRMIASSRKKTDKRDAYWIAKALQTGMTPHPVYLPSGEIRELRSLLSQRDALKNEVTRWSLRARKLLESAGFRPATGRRALSKTLDEALASPDGLPAHLETSVKRLQRMQRAAAAELQELDRELQQRAAKSDVIKKLMTIPGVGEKVALTILAAVGDISRFRSARELCSYAGLVPSVRQSGSTQILGHITGAGNPRLRSNLVQAGQVLLWRCQSSEAAPLKALAQRVYTTRQRKKIAVVAAARFILRTAFYVMRDNTDYNPARLPAVA